MTLNVFYWSISECDVFASVLHLLGTHHSSLPHISSGWGGAVSSRKTYTGVCSRTQLYVSLRIHQFWISSLKFNNNSERGCVVQGAERHLKNVLWSLSNYVSAHKAGYSVRHVLLFQQLRKLVLEIIHRIPTNEHLRPHTKNILSVMFRFLEVWVLFSWRKKLHYHILSNLAKYIALSQIHRFWVVVKINCSHKCNSFIFAVVVWSFNIMHLTC